MAAHDNEIGLARVGQPHNFHVGNSNLKLNLGFVCQVHPRWHHAAQPFTILALPVQEFRFGCRLALNDVQQRQFSPVVFGQCKCLGQRAEGSRGEVGRVKDVVKAIT